MWRFRERLSGAPRVVLGEHLHQNVAEVSAERAKKRRRQTAPRTVSRVGSNKTAAAGGGGGGGGDGGGELTRCLSEPSRSGPSPRHRPGRPCAPQQLIPTPPALVHTRATTMHLRTKGSCSDSRPEHLVDLLVGRTDQRPCLAQRRHPLLFLPERQENLRRPELRLREGLPIDRV